MDKCVFSRKSKFHSSMHRFEKSYPPHSPSSSFLFFSSSSRFFLSSSSCSSFIFFSGSCAQTNKSVIKHSERQPIGITTKYIEPASFLLYRHVKSTTKYIEPASFLLYRHTKSTINHTEPASFLLQTCQKSCSEKCNLVYKLSKHTPFYLYEPCG